MKDLAIVVNNANMNVTPFETIDAIIKAGFKNVFIQWYNEDLEYTQEEQLNYIREKGLNIIFAHLGYQGIKNIWLDNDIGKSLVERYKKDIEICKNNNINLVIMHLTSKYDAPKFNKIGLSRIKEIVDFAEKLDVKIAFENTKIKGYLEYVFENINNKNIGICYDAGHCHAHFNDEFNFKLFKDRIFAVHLHDNDKSDDQHLLPYDGTINWNKVLKDLYHNGYNGPITLEICYKKEYFEMTIEEFYKKGYEIGIKLSKIIQDIEKRII